MDDDIQALTKDFDNRHAIREVLLKTLRHSTDIKVNFDSLSLLNIITEDSNNEEKTSIMTILSRAKAIAAMPLIS